MILQNISFEVGEGERVGLRGKSGIGKTTLCRLLAGYEKPRSGEILLDGRPITDYRGYCPVQMVWQHPEQAVNPRRRMHTVLEEGDGITEDIIKGLGIEEAWKMRFPAELSGGEQQRVAIARALAKNPKVLLCDEPTGALDYNTGKAVLKLLQNTCRKQGKTVIVITHNQALTAMADRVITVKSGTIQKIEKNEHIVDVDEIEW